MTEKTRRVLDPIVEPDGTLVVHSVTTPEDFDIRARTTIGSTKVIPVIFIPGIMGTNLRVRQGVKLPDGIDLKPGEAAWRPPNNLQDALYESRKWKSRDPGQRQKILNARILEVDDGGDLAVSACGLSNEVMRERGWGEIYTGAYGTLLFELQSHLDKTFRLNALKKREIRSYWKEVMECHPSHWGLRRVEHITEPELEKYAQYQYPVYAVGYNWLQSCADSAERLVKRIGEITEYWSSRKHQCTKVILITHSMGGLVARAAAKQVPDKIAGVIHGAMPALGAPVAFRRIVGGLETSNPKDGYKEDFAAKIFAEIGGETTLETTPVMAASAGILQLLPTHLYPKPWLFLRSVSSLNKKDTYHDLVALPRGDPYAMYRDTKSWYRMINPALADPAGLYKRKKEGAAVMISTAIDEAERFHKEVLTKTAERNGKKISVPYYHDNTFAFYGADSERRTFSRICWLARETANDRVPLTANNIHKAMLLGNGPSGAREVEVEGRYRLRFEIEHQDASGDDTVPECSGAGPEAHVKQVFRTVGYSHQGSFQSRKMLLLTRHLIVKIVQGLT